MYVSKREREREADRWSESVYVSERNRQRERGNNEARTALTGIEIPNIYASLTTRILGTDVVDTSVIAPAQRLLHPFSLAKVDHVCRPHALIQASQPSSLYLGLGNGNKVIPVYFFGYHSSEEPWPKQQ